MVPRIPRLETIEAFIEAAHAPSFRIAAERCAISPAAFSRRIQAFRQFVGRELFERNATGMQLTFAGQECLAALEPQYRAMSQAALDLGASGKSQKVTISLSHSLAMAWLIPRLEQFRTQNPGVEVEIRTTRTAEDIRSGAADLGVCANDIDASGLRVQNFLYVDVTPVACPRIAEDFRRGTTTLVANRLLSPKQFPDMWRWWAREVGSDGDTLPPANTFDMAYAVYEAAAAGWGVAPGMSVTVEPHLRSGRLVSLGLPAARFPGGYRLAAKASRLRSPPVAAFWDWLIVEGRLTVPSFGLPPFRPRLQSPDRPDDSRLQPPVVPKGHAALASSAQGPAARSPLSDQ